MSREDVLDDIAAMADDIAEKIEGDYGVFLAKQKNLATGRWGWTASAMLEGEPFGHDTGWHADISTAADDGERLVDAAIRKEAEKQAKERHAGG